MNNWIKILCSTGLFMIGFNVNAINIGILDSEEISKSPYVEAQTKRLIEQLKSFEKTLVEKAKALEVKTANFERDKSILSKVEKEKELGIISKMRKELQEANVKAEQESHQLNQMEAIKLQALIKEITQKIAKKNKLDLVLTSNDVLYFANELDVTRQVLSMLDEAHKSQPKK